MTLRKVALAMALFGPLGWTAGTRAQNENPGRWHARLQAILDQYGPTRSEKPLQEVLAPLPVAERVRVLMPLIDYGAEKSNGFSGPGSVHDLLGKWADASAASLVKALDHATTGKRLNAARAIVQLQFQNQSLDRLPWAEAAGPKLSRLLTTDPSAEVRSEAADALASLKSQVAPYASALVKALHDKNAQVARSALFAIKEAGPDAWEAIPHLLNILKQPDHTDRGTAAEALGAMGFAARQTVPAILEAIVDNPAQDTYALDGALYWVADSYEQNIPAGRMARIIRKAAGHSAPCWMAYHRNYRDLNVAGALAEALEDPEASDWAMHALIRMKPEHPALLSYLRTLAESNRPNARVYAAVAYWSVTGNTEEGLVLIRQILNKAGTEEKETLWTVVGEMGPRAKPLLKDLKPNTKDQSPWTPLDHIASYYQIHGQPDKYLDYVADQMRPRYANDACDEAEDVLQLLGPMADSKTPGIRRSLGDFSEWATNNRWHAAAFHRQVGPTDQTRRSLPALKRLIDPAVEKSAYNRRIAAEAIWSISRDAQSALRGLRSALSERGLNFFYTLNAYERMGSDALPAVESLQKIATQDPNPHFREAARRALNTIENARPPEPTELQFDQWYRQLARRPNRAEAYLNRQLGRIPLTKRRAILALVKKLQDPDWRTRENATDQLQRTLPGSINILKQALKKTRFPETRMRLRKLVRHAEGLKGPDNRRTYPHDKLEENRRYARILQTLALIEHLQERQAAPDPP
ncbi:MAG: HEAT repeat domain-containing protein [Phycisphaeraceae bacterium]|nr:HEAT repeat domain-containing protein [Phycisphaeraceae bacterium]